MKTSKLGPAEREQKDIQTKIDILVKTINKYNEMLLYPHMDEKSLINIRLNLDREELDLKKLKDKYPEHFI
jgi:hypothetical protein